MTTLKPYLTYADSGREPLGLIPDHWKVQRGKYVFRSIDIRSLSGEEELLSVSETDGVVPRREKTVTMFMAESYVGHKLCWPDDLVINSLWAWKKGLGFSRYHGIVSSAYGVYRLQHPEQHDPRYLHRALRSNMYDQELRVRSKGVWTSRLQLTDEAFLDMPLVLPPLDEQRAIADFLDGMDARITRFIAARRKMIALLEEKKQAVINQAVTRGLDPSVPMKESGVDWLGEIPAHWELRRFKHLARINSGQVDPREEPFASQVLIAPNHIVSGTGHLRALETASEQGADSGKYQVRAGQVIYSKIRPYLRKAAIAPFDCLCSADMYPITPHPSLLNTDFFLRAILSPGSTQFIVDASLRARMPKVNREALGELWLAFPSLQEQEEVVDHINRETSRIDTLTSRHRREIELMQEYRTRLISDVVTGKLDVRGVELPAVEEVTGEEIEATIEEGREEANQTITLAEI